MAERLADHTTLRLGGPAARLVRATSEAELIAAVADADQAGEPVLILGGGSNLVIADAGFDGTVLLVETRGVLADQDEADAHACCGGVKVTVAAGESWDEFVARCVDNTWTGVEALSGIPGLVGATPIQNVGAYGQDVAQTIASVRTWDRVARAQRTFAVSDCDFGYRNSLFKATSGRYVVLDVTFQLKVGTLSAPIGYAELAASLGVSLGERAPLVDVRSAVLELRRGKGMVLDPVDHDTWSAGSFFTNPVIAADRVPAGAPAWPTADGLVKTSAAWLIDHAGFGKGYPDAEAPARLSTKHPLALTNRGNATTADLLALAREVRDGVQATYEILLEAEPVLVGVDL